MSSSLVSGSPLTIQRREKSDPLRVVDSALVWIIAAIGAVAAVGLLVAPRFLLPAEDAVILFQYSRNLAETAAITYIHGGVHAEGATDFAWMLLIAFGMKLGISPYWLIAVINFISIFILGFLLIRISGKRITGLALLFVAGSFAMLPQITAAAQGFSTLPFACLLVLMTWRFLERDNVGTPVAALALCLFRPDGVVFAVPLLLAALIDYPDCWRRLRLDTALFVVPGLIYFFWRWHYFGHFLPLTFMVKADAPNSVRFLGLFVYSSIRQVKILCLFVFGAITILLSLKGSQPRNPSNRVILVCFVTIPTLLYMLNRLDQDIGHRFFIYLPVSVAILIAMNWHRLGRDWGYLLRATLICWLIFPARIWASDIARVWPAMFDTRLAIAKELATVPHGSMIVTEAGLLPYYSHWAAYDAWGLNTAQFAERLIQPSDVDKVHPDLLMILPETVDAGSACATSNEWKTPYQARTWSAMTRNVIAGTRPDEYDLWQLPWGNSSYLAHYHLASANRRYECWFVRRDSPLRPAVEEILARHHAQTAEQYRASLKPAVVRSGPPIKIHRNLVTRVAGLFSRIWHLLDE